MKGLINQEEIALTGRCIKLALEKGASAARASLGKSMANTIGILDGKIDRICSNLDRSIFLQIYSRGRYGAFSTNRLDRDSLERFTAHAVEMTGVLAPESCYSLPDPARKAEDCSKGDELELLDKDYFNITAEEKIQAVLQNHQDGALSMECEYSDSLDDNVIIDSEGFMGRSSDTQYSYSAAATVSGGKSGKKYEGYFFSGSLFKSGFRMEGVDERAIALAKRKIGERKIRSGKYRIIVDCHCSSRLIGPVINALNAYSLHQHNSFLEDSLERKIFSDDLTVMDFARVKGKCGSRLFDTEGVATSNSPVISRGVVKEYFTNTFMAAKAGFAPTVESVTRPTVMPFSRLSPCKSEQNNINLKDLLRSSGDAVYITAFNGGNCNSATGDFSFGIEGFLIRSGEIAHPIREAVMTSNMLELWNSISAAGNDALPHLGWQIPSLVFENIEINA